MKSINKPENININNFSDFVEAFSEVYHLSIDMATFNTKGIKLIVFGHFDDAGIAAMSYDFQQNGWKQVVVTNFKSEDTSTYLCKITLVFPEEKINQIEVTSPEKIDSIQTKTFLSTVISKFEEKLTEELKSNSSSKYFHLVISGEYSRDLLNQVEKTYLDAGFIKAECKTSSENGERGGLTGLQLWTAISN